MAEKHKLWMAKLKPARWRVMKGPRVMPCSHKTAKGWVPCLTPVRVKIAEPGVYERDCPSCGATSYYRLTPALRVAEDGVTPLMFDWITAAEAEQWYAEATADCVRMPL